MDSSADEPPSPARVLVVDGHAANAAGLIDMLASAEVVARHVPTAAAALAALEAGPIDVVVSDLRLADTTGLELIAKVAAHDPSLPVVLVTDDVTVPQALEALRAGAADLLLKPFVAEEAVFVIKKALARAARQAPEQPAAAGTGALLGDSRAMQEALAVLRQAAPGTSTVLIRGESGTGKELAARALHDLGSRRSQAFVKIDCAALPETLLESELFGYEKGAFTGAVTRKPGRVELADGGTLFLDEIGELSRSLQAKLLRLLQDREIERLGGTRTIKVDVRVVAATHRDLETMVERGEFRQDLFYRLNVVPLWLPPLRARRDDVPLLARHFCALYAKQNQKHGVRLGDDAIGLLKSQRWPGNVRQLQNFMERLVVFAGAAVIGADEIRTELSRQVKFATQPGGATRSTHSARKTESSVVGPLDIEVHAAEKKALERALRHSGNNRTLAARLLGVSRSTFYAKLEEHGLL